MRDQRTPRVVKLQKFKLLYNERSKLLFGIALHCAQLRREINLSESYSTFKRFLERFFAEQFNHYLSCPYQKLIDIANYYGINVNLWEFYQDPNHCPQTRNPHLTRKLHAMFNHFGAIHFIVKNNVIEYLILKPEAYGLNKEMTMNFKQAISVHCGLPFNEVNEKWSSDQIQLPRDEPRLKSSFGVGIELWCRRAKKCSKEIVDVVPTLIFKSRFKNPVKLMVDNWLEDKNYIDIKDAFTICQMTLYHCPQDYCLFATTNRQRFDKHCFGCKDETIVDFEQRNLLEGDIVKWMIEENFLTKRPQIDSKHVHFDIETMLKPCHTSKGKTVCFGEERIVSIGVSDNISGKIRSKIFAREQLDEKSLCKMVDIFWNYLLVLREHFRKTLPFEVNKAFFKIKEMLFPTEKDVFGKTISLPLSDPLKVKLYSAYNFLDGLRSLKVVGWNSENFGTDSKLFISVLLFNCVY